MLVVVVVNVDTCRFWLSRPDLSPWGYGNRCFLVVRPPLNSEETELGSSDQEASPSDVKNTAVDLVSCRIRQCVPTSISSDVVFPRSLGVICYDRWFFSKGHKKYFKDLTNIWGLRSDFVGCNSFLESNSPDIHRPGNFSISR